MRLAEPLTESKRVGSVYPSTNSFVTSSPRCDFCVCLYQCIGNEVSKTNPIVRDLTALFGCETGLLLPPGFGMLAGVGNVYSGRTHVLKCRWVDSSVLGDGGGGWREGQRQLNRFVVEGL